MKLKIEMELPIEVKGKYFYVYGNQAFNDLLGTTAGANSPGIYNAEKPDKSNPKLWKVPIVEIEKRTKVIEKNIQSMQNKLDYIKKVLKTAKKGVK